jgi:hypothetical protein
MEAFMTRSAIVRLALLAGLLAGSVVAAPVVAAMQSAAQVSAADAAPFVGDWTLTLQGPNGPGSFDLSVKVDKEKVVGEIANAQMATMPITDVSKADKTLVLRYVFTWENNPVDAAVSLTPAADGKVAAQIDFGGGAYTMTGTAAKKEAAKK